LIPRIAIACGDPAGIGPEISLKAALDPRVRAICRPVLVGDRAVFALYGKTSEVEILEIKHPKPKIGEIDPAHGRAAIAAAETAIRGALAGEFDAVVGAPHTEAAIHAAGIEFDGYPSFVARLAGLPPEDGILMLCFEYQGREVRIAHVTLHVAVGEALKLITRERILKTIRAVNATLKNPRIAVSGVNPHAGEAGAFGREEIEIVAPALEQARREGMAVDGPIGADTLIQRAGYDAYVVMFHDQGHVAAKLLAPQRVAGLTIGTPVLFSSVAHGSALDIAGQGRASAEAMVEAVARLVGAQTASSVNEKRGVA
jgi:4-hydroxythreonine-4-phosphate dehydrogenase